MKHLLLTLMALLVTLASCNKEDENPIIEPNADYRTQFVGIYDCTKSSTSFDDDMFTTDIEIEVKIDSTMDSLVIVNDIKIPVDLDGRFGLEEYGGSYYDLDLSDDKIRLSIDEIFPFGLAIPCYIQGEKR